MFGDVDDDDNDNNDSNDDDEDDMDNDDFVLKGQLRKEYRLKNFYPKRSVLPQS